MKPNGNRRIGYARVSTDDQSVDLQKDALTKAGCSSIYTEIASGKNTLNRESLRRCLSTLTSGDTLVVWRLDRLGRSVSDLVKTIGDLEHNHIFFESLTEKIDTQSHTGKLIFHVLAALAEFERNLIRERTNAGLAAARSRGRIGGRRFIFGPKQVQEIKQLHHAQIPISNIAKQFGVSRATIYNYLKK